MKIMQFILTLSLCCITVSSFASPATDKSVDKLMQLSNISEIFKQSTRDMQPYFDDQAEALVRQVTGAQTLNIDQQNAALQISALYSDIQQQLVTDPEYLNMFKSLFKKTFTEEEVQAGVGGGMAAMGGGCCGGGGGGHDHDHGSAGSCGTSAPEPKQSHGGCGCH